MNGYGIVSIKGTIVKNSGSSESQLVRVDETVRKLVPKPETFVDDEDISLSCFLVGVSGCRRHNWDIALGRIRVCVVGSNVTDTSCELEGYRIGAECTSVSVRIEFAAA